MANDAISPWLSTLRKVDGFDSISDPQAFAHDESKYDQTYRSEALNLQVGHGLLNLLKVHEIDITGAALEIGCGTGLMSLGLAERGTYELLLLTDPSPAFLRITKEKLQRAGISNPAVRFAVMKAEELERIPAKTLSLVAMRSTLHHVSDVDCLIATAAAALRPGGAMVVQEPCWEGYVLMGAMAQFMPAVLKAAGAQLTQVQLDQIRLFTKTISFYARRDVDKSKAEDKHLFRVDQLMRRCRDCGLSLEFLPNMTFESFAPEGLAPAQSNHSFTVFFRDYLRYCMSFDARLVALFEQHMQPYCAYIEELSANNNGPYMHGIFLARK